MEREAEWAGTQQRTGLLERFGLRLGLETNEFRRHEPLELAPAVVPFARKAVVLHERSR